MFKHSGRMFQGIDQLPGLVQYHMLCASRHYVVQMLPGVVQVQVSSSVFHRRASWLVSMASIK